ncbi:UNC-50 family-domain-containing protein [Tribonema minus]|uniref:UNC-50 family-domain-containing protein n=1 Tax=Tribonema minus TaxID=303371 RepID=A0A835ZBD9_9STRA|nr:UNC-50 family-domain-containing protein [Tribonema minus]
MALGLRAFWGYIALIANAVLLHWLLFGVAAATAGRALADAHMLVRRAHSVEQRVKWLYAFDIHCNAFLMLFIAVYVGQKFLLLPVLLGRSAGALLLSNALYALGFGAYCYIPRAPGVQKVRTRIRLILKRIVMTRAAPAIAQCQKSLDDKHSSDADTRRLHARCSPPPPPPRSLPFLCKTETFLYPVVAVGMSTSGTAP